MRLIDKSKVVLHETFEVLVLIGQKNSCKSGAAGCGRGYVEDELVGFGLVILVDGVRGHAHAGGVAVLFVFCLDFVN